ncbi:hypothetical protein [Neobacillus vireti]|uniref:Peptidase n=1 Tax=Neobacillus vireti LMG 21834 TaxID=1131730 RepID=A0AB94IU24_9BACI|nr:hypothetical protein [Neobacillus vireti]ETI70589.1 hypothetical protein BAVI_01405 [Neobacillus vireti LMG 21834]KLT15334.1 hypothetical protein AA980_24520 [Neobacillus vireti]
MSITFDSCLSLKPVDIRKEKKHYIVEDKTSGEFFEMPEVCIDAINFINNGKTLGDIEQLLKEKYPNEEVNLIDFAGQLLELQLIAEVDGVIIDKKILKIDRLGFLWLSPQIGKIFFNKISLFLYAILFITNVCLFIAQPVLFPHYQDLFIFDLMVLNIPAWMLLTFILVLIHEFGHILAMRAQNLPTKLEVSHRLFLVVLETDMSTVWKLPSGNRNVLFLAGLCFDTVILTIALISQLIFANGPAIFLSIMHVVVLDTFIRMVYQCCVYMKTDLYYVFENVSGCYNLMENAQQQLRKWLPFQQSASNGEVVFAEERRVVTVYSIFYFIGVFVTLGLFVIYYIPQLLFAWKKVLPGFAAGPASLPFWDAMLFTLQILIGIGLLLYALRKKNAR